MSGIGSDGNEKRADGGSKANVRYDVGAMASQFGDSLARQGAPLGELRDADLPDIISGKSQSGFGAYGVEEEGRSSEGFAGSYSRKSKAPVVRRGKAIAEVDPAMYPFNVVAGSRSGSSFVVSRDDRMSVREARRKMEAVLDSFGLLSESHEFCYSFTQAMFVAHALNGASIVGPGRASFTVGGSEFSYGDVIRVLGPDARRFFRAYADDIARALSKVLELYDPADHESVRICGQIRSIALARHLVQFPYLIHDSADACVKISMAEMAAVMRSKELVLKDGNNAVEGLMASTSK